MAIRKFATRAAASEFAKALRLVGFEWMPGKRLHLCCAELTFHTWVEGGQFVVAFWNIERKPKASAPKQTCSNGQPGCHAERRYRSGRCHRCEGRARYWSNPTDRARRQARARAQRVAGRAAKVIA